MKILLVTPLPPPVGGDSTWALKYIKYLKENNVPVDYVNTAVIGKRAENVENYNSLFEELKRSIFIWYGILKKIVTFKPDVVHFNTNCSPAGLIRDVLSGVLLKIANIPFCLHCRCNVEDQIKNSKIGLGSFQILSSMSSIVIVLNQSSELFVRKISKTDVTIVPNFINKDYVLNGDKVINSKLNRILFVGHVRFTKGFKEIIEISKQFLDKKFLIAGPILDEVKVIEIPSNVILLGEQNQNQIVNLLDSCDIFLFPSYTEGFSNSLLEAMSRGLPCICSNVGANMRMLERFGGIVTEPKNIQQNIDAIIKLEALEMRSAMSKWNILKVKESYTIENVFNQLSDIYMNMLINK